MKMIRLLLLCLSLFSTQALAETLKEFEQRITAELTAKNSEAAKLFVAANEARERNAPEEAARLYAKVREQEPDFVHATRRLCTIEEQLGRRKEALGHCEEAVAKDDSAENLSALARVLSSDVDGNPSLDDIQRAFDLSNKAALKDPSSVLAQVTRCQLALYLEATETLTSCADRLLVIAPELVPTHVFLTIRHAFTNDFSRAYASLERAHELGFPDAEYQSMKKSLLDTEPFGSWLWRTAGVKSLWIFGLWALGLLLLLGVGLLLNAAAMRAASQPPTEASGKAVGLSKTLRNAYRTILWVCCAYYYLSLPLVSLLVVAVGGGAILLFVAMGYIPIKLVVIIAILMLGTLFALVKGIFTRPKEGEPGERLDLDKHPKFKALLQEVADKVGTRVVDRVYLTPGTDLAVLERGSLSQQLKGHQERCLLLGVGVLDGFQRQPFQAILAHEYGHFSNRDTAGGGFALAVRRSLLFTAIGLAQSGNAQWFNPAWIFLRGFEQIFLRVSQGASRLQEVLADRWAALSYGSAAFISGFQHVIERSERFRLETNAAIKEVLTPETPRALQNLYQYPLSTTLPTEELHQSIETALNAEPHPFDSHPSPKQRIAWVQALHIEAPSNADNEPVWEFFSSRQEIEEWMTAQVRDNIRASTGKYVPEKEDSEPSKPEVAPE